MEVQLIEDRKADGATIVLSDDEEDSCSRRMSLGPKEVEVERERAAEAGLAGKEGEGCVEGEGNECQDRAEVVGEASA